MPRGEHEQAIARSPEAPNVLAERCLPEVDGLERTVEDLLDLARTDADGARRRRVASFRFG